MLLLILAHIAHVQARNFRVTWSSCVTPSGQNGTYSEVLVASPCWRKFCLNSIFTHSFYKPIYHILDLFDKSIWSRRFLSLKGEMKKKWHVCSYSQYRWLNTYWRRHLLLRNHILHIHLSLTHYLRVCSVSLSCAHQK